MVQQRKYSNLCIHSQLLIYYLISYFQKEKNKLQFWKTENQFEKTYKLRKKLLQNDFSTKCSRQWGRWRDVWWWIKSCHTQEFRYFERLSSHFLLDSFLLAQCYLQNWSVSMCPTIRHFWEESCMTIERSFNLCI